VNLVSLTYSLPRLSNDCGVQSGRSRQSRECWKISK
jgi:hypothetical protein